MNITYLYRTSLLSVTHSVMWLPFLPLLLIIITGKLVIITVIIILIITTEIISTYMLPARGTTNSHTDKGGESPTWSTEQRAGLLPTARIHIQFMQVNVTANIYCVVYTRHCALNKC